MNELIKFLHEHPYISTWLLNNVATALISNLPAPTRESTAKYVYGFKVFNSIIGNFKRAQSTAIEKSPNWQDAVEKHIAENLPPSLQRVQE